MFIQNRITWWIYNWEMSFATYLGLWKKMVILFFRTEFSIGSIFRITWWNNIGNGKVSLTHIYFFLLFFYSPLLSGIKLMLEHSVQICMSYNFWKCKNDKLFIQNTISWWIYNREMSFAKYLVMWFCFSGQNFWFDLYLE